MFLYKKNSLSQLLKYSIIFIAFRSIFTQDVNAYHNQHHRLIFEKKIFGGGGGGEVKSNKTIFYQIILKIYFYQDTSLCEVYILGVERS